jgi:hypothetical protein
VKSFLKHLVWILNIASRFVPDKIKVLMVAISTIAGVLIALLDRCDQKPNTPALPIPQETPQPTPEPTVRPVPIPTKPPLPQLRSKNIVKAGEPFLVELCHAGRKYNVSLYADNYRLGYMGFGKECMELFISLNQAGKRKLIAKDDSGLRVSADVLVQ